MFKRTHHQPSAVTLLELIGTLSIMALLTVSTLAIMANGRVARERASLRSELALLAQSELERLRATPLAQTAEGIRTFLADSKPGSNEIVETVTWRADGFLQLEVIARKNSTVGPLEVSLTSIHPGGRP